MTGSFTEIVEMKPQTVPNIKKQKKHKIKVYLSFQFNLMSRHLFLWLKNIYVIYQLIFTLFDSLASLRTEK